MMINLDFKAKENKNSFEKFGLFNLKFIILVSVGKCKYHDTKIKITTTITKPS